MICPYCKREMEAGVIVCDGRRKPSWSSENRYVPLADFNLVSLFSTYKVEAFYCQPCQKIVLDTKN